MAMFGAKPRNPYDTPGYGMGEMGAFPPETMPENSIPLPPNPFAQQPQMQQPGMFGAPQSNYAPVKGTLSEKLMALGGIFGNLGGQRNDAVQQYFQTLEGRREEQRKAQLAEAARYAPIQVGDNLLQLNRQTNKYDTLFNGQKAPEAPQIVRLQQIYDDPATPPSIRATVKAAIDAQTDPVVSLPGGGLDLRSHITRGMGGGGAGPSPEATKALLNGEGTDAQFDQLFGPGAAAKVRGSAGGPMPSASGTFPIR